MLKKAFGIASSLCDSRISKITINTDDVKKTSDGVKYYENVKFEDLSYMSCNILEKDIFDTSEQAEIELARRRSIEQKSISEKIKSPEDLIRGMFRKMYCEEYTDYDYIEVVKKKAKEYFNIDLE